MFNNTAGLREALCKTFLDKSNGNVPIQLNAPHWYAPVGSALLILIKDKLVKARRTKIADKCGIMEYRLDDGEIISGKFHWGYQ